MNDYFKESDATANFDSQFEADIDDDTDMSTACDAAAIVANDNEEYEKAEKFR